MVHLPASGLLDELLDGLLGRLAQAAPALAVRTVQEELDAVPKLELQLEHAAPKPPQVAVKINDPVRAPAKVAKDADAGSNWFNMRQRELTPELKRDFAILKNRAVLDRKRHYKKDNWEIPKYFHTGTVIEGRGEYYLARMAKRNRGRTIAEEILRDGDSTLYYDKKFDEITEKKTRSKRSYDRFREKRRGY